MAICNSNTFLREAFIANNKDDVHDSNNTKYMFKFLIGLVLFLIVFFLYKRVYK